MTDKFIALIPAYKPSELLIDMLEEIKDTPLTPVVIDDGSGSEFAEIFEKAKEYAPVIAHEVNKGKGAALKTGYTYIKENFAEDVVIVTMDSDGQHRTEDAIRLCNMAMENPGALILGSRKLAENVPLRSQFGNTLTRFVYQISTGIKVHDTQTGLRAFSANLIPFMNSIGGDRYEYEINVLLDCTRADIPIIETEIPTIYLDNNSASHFNPLRDSIKIYKEILKFSASSLLSFLVDYALYTLLFIFTGQLQISHIGARILSSVFNFTVNKKLVFKSKGNTAKSASGYFALVAVIIVLSTFVLSFFVNVCGINEFAAKILTELIFFVFSWFAQHFVVFKKKK
ncbi:MAG: bifunctional glycosyltransferase family 2/GtrA family protein [Clostridia bacterium]|nr:bifunctional glycosyltransferase family 2/GtrA family protein [Clostridia bacterium]